MFAPVLVQTAPVVASGGCLQRRGSGVDDRRLFIPGPANGKVIDGNRPKCGCFRVALMIYKVPLSLSPQPEDGFTVTSPLMPELVTERGTIEEALNNVGNALGATIEAYQDLGRPRPKNVQI